MQGYRLIGFFLRKPVTVLMLFIALFVLGIIALTKIPVQQFPSGIEIPVMFVNVSYSGGDSGISPIEVEQNLVKPIEEELSALSGIEDLHSEARAGSARFFLFFKQSADMTVMFAEVKDKIDRVRSKSKEALNAPFIGSWNPNDEAILDCGIMWDPKVVETPFYFIEEVIMQRLGNVHGVARTEITGLVEERLYIELIGSKVEKYNLSPWMLNRKLRDDNFVSEIGRIKSYNEKFFAVTDMTFQSLEDVKNFPITENINLEDIADINFRSSRPDEIIRIDGLPAVLIEIYKGSAANTVELSNNILDAIEELQQNPELEGFTYNITSNQGADIMEGINNLTDSAIFGGVCALFILFFFLRRIRMTILISMTIPLSVVIAITALYFGGGSINLLTLMGFTLAVGMLVDNAVVVTESIARYKEAKVSGPAASFLGAGEVMFAIILATLTTVIVFVPLVLMGNKTFTFIMKNIGLPLCAALFASLFVAAVLIPPGAAYVADKKKESKFFLFRFLYSVTGGIVNKTRIGYVKALKFVLKHRFIVFILIGIGLYFTYMAVFPEDKGGWEDEHEYKLHITESAGGKATRIRIRVSMPDQSTVNDTNEVFIKIREILKKNKKKVPYKHILESFNDRRGRISLFMDVSKDWDTFEMTNYLKTIFPVMPGVNIRVGWWGGGGFDPNTQRVTVLLTGSDSVVLMGLAEKIQQRMEFIEGLSDVTTEVEDGNDEMQLNLNRGKTTELGVNPTTLMMNLVYALNGSRLNDYKEDGRTIPIVVRYQLPRTVDTNSWRFREHNLNRQDIFELPVPMLNGATLPFKVFVGSEPSFSKSLHSIKRQNRKTSLQVTANCPQDKYLMVQKRIQELFNQFDLPKGYKWSFGQRESKWQSEQDTSYFAIIAAFVGVFLVMGFFFESLIMPFAVLAAVPLAGIGATWFLILTDTPLEMIGFVGLIILIGLVVNNGIVMIDLVNRLKLRGRGTYEALIEAGKFRFRPILMTSMTTIFGLLPMASGKLSFLGQNYSPIGKIVIGGLITSTVLMLFVVPVVYSVLDGARTNLLSILNFALKPIKFKQKD